MHDYLSLPFPVEHDFGLKIYLLLVEYSAETVLTIVIVSGNRLFREWSVNNNSIIAGVAAF